MLQVWAVRIPRTGKCKDNNQQDYKGLQGPPLEEIKFDYPAFKVSFMDISVNVTIVQDSPAVNTGYEESCLLTIQSFDQVKNIFSWA